MRQTVMLAGGRREALRVSVLVAADDVHGHDVVPAVKISMRQIAIITRRRCEPKFCLSLGKSVMPEVVTHKVDHDELSMTYPTLVKALSSDCVTRR